VVVACPLQCVFHLFCSQAKVPPKSTKSQRSAERLNARIARDAAAAAAAGAAAAAAAASDEENSEPRVSQPLVRDPDEADEDDDEGYDGDEDVVDGGLAATTGAPESGADADVSKRRKLNAAPDLVFMCICCWAHMYVGKNITIRP